jgi:hypothetical protein
MNVEVNGRDLRDVVREIESPFAEAEGHPQLAGQYTGLPVTHLMPPSQHLLGQPTGPYGDTDKVTLLQCSCGEPGCWPLLARVTAAADTVIWSEFEQPHRRGWSYEKLGPFVFDRRQYEQAIEPGSQAI